MQIQARTSDLGFRQLPEYNAVLFYSIREHPPQQLTRNRPYFYHFLKINNFVMFLNKIVKNKTGLDGIDMQ